MQLILALSAPAKLLLSGAAITVGVLVGLIPALVLGMVVGLVPRPGRARRATPVREAPSWLAAPALAPVALEAPAVVLPASMRQHHVELAPEPDEEQVDLEVAAARERHRSIYEDEYAKQLDHVDALRQSIRSRLAIGAQPPSDDAERDRHT